MARNFHLTFLCKKFSSKLHWLVDFIEAQILSTFRHKFFLEQDKRERTDNICTSIVCTNLRSFSCSPMGDDKKKDYLQ